MGGKEEGKLFDVKKNIYRAGDRIIEALSNYFGIMPKDGEFGITAWEVIDRMSEREEVSGVVINKEGVHPIKSAMTIQNRGVL